MLFYLHYLELQVCGASPDRVGHSSNGQSPHNAKKGTRRLQLEKNIIINLLILHVIQQKK